MTRKDDDDSGIRDIDPFKPEDSFGYAGGLMTLINTIEFTTE
jgi:hypothetical protein